MRTTPQTVAVPRGEVDLLRGVLRVPDGDALALPARELELLRYLAQRPGQDVDRDELLREVWGYADQVVSRAIDHTVKRLRVRIEHDPAAPRCLITAHGTGYRLVPADAVPRAAPRAARAVITLADRTVDLAQQRVEGREARALTAQEARFLEVLAASPGDVVSVDRVMAAVWPEGGTARALKNLVFRLRPKIEIDPAAPTVLVTVRGGGFRLDVPARAPEGEISAPPPPPNRFLGRGAVVGEVARRLASERLVTVVGPAGVGKTRLALEVLSAHHRGSWWFELAPLGPDELARTVALQAGAPSSATGALVAALRGRPGPVVFDNAEHVVEPLSRLIDELRVAGLDGPVLVTSQVRLGLPWESVLSLDPLDPESAVALFEDRAAAAGGVVAASASVRRLVDALDRLPLALELAASISRAVPPDDLLKRLGRRLDVLESDDPTAPRRHQSLRAALDGSWSMLEPGEREALARASVFRGAFDLDAADAVLGPRAPLLISRLVARSLVSVTTHEGSAHYALLQSVRSHAAEHLDPDTAAEARAAHGAHYAALASSLLAAGGGTDLAQDDTRALEGLMPDLLAAWDHAEGHADRSGLARLLSGWLRRTGAAGRAADLLTAALHAGPAPRDRMHLLAERSLARITTGEAAAATGDAEAARALAVSLGDADGETLAHTALGLIALRDERGEDAEAHLRLALAASERLDPRRDRDAHLRVAALNHLGMFLSRASRYDEAAPLLRRALAGARKPGARGIILLNLGLLHLRSGDPEAADVDAEASVANLERTPYAAQHSQALVLRGDARWIRGDHAGAEPWFRAGLATARRAGSRTDEACAAQDLAGLLVEMGRAQDALAVTGDALAVVPDTVRVPRAFLQLYAAAAWALLGHPRDAAASHVAAVALADEAGDPTARAACAVLAPALGLAPGPVTAADETFDLQIARRIAARLTLGLARVSAGGGASQTHPEERGAR